MSSLRHLIPTYKHKTNPNKREKKNREREMNKELFFILFYKGKTNLVFVCV